jgi:hypothetical protein
MINVTIDSSWEPVEGEEGLYLETKTVTLSNGTTSTLRILHSDDTHVFYAKADEEIPAEERLYSIIAVLGIYDSPSNYKSVLRENWMEVLNAPKKEETI